MCLLYKMSLGDEGFFAPYLRTLPYPVTLRDWSPDERAEVEPYVPNAAATTTSLPSCPA